ncbi:hypothetical protein [Saccharothrix variisporea]|uniref:Uncharacterized protein n=1 Tax=Saccharothrix variisporea TaxID=543527 RepID=A0A495X8H6_9PSEU|nr:hypothetical protein [Saccharothrix variisporea]RKT69164.1 hypothetical protein DFJ66_2359 [Saccharothrix variisporea]
MAARSATDEDVAGFFTASAGFIEGGIDEVGAALVAWRRELGFGPRVREVRGSLVDQLRALNPLLSGARPRELLVSAGGWVAYFDCFAGDTDAASVCSVLAGRLGVRAVKVYRAADVVRCAGMASGVGVQFHVWGPGGDEPLGYLRTLEAVHDGNRWVFDQSGSPFDFEETEHYGERRVKDRFTVEMLDRYCSALGIRLTDPGSYGQVGMLVESAVVVPPGAKEVWI